MGSFANRIKPWINNELRKAHLLERSGDGVAAFAHLERAHVVGQRSTWFHVRVHIEMLGWAIRHRDFREITGQLFRIIGAATKTVFGLIPTGNTGGTNVSPFRAMPIDEDLATVIEAAKKGNP